MHIHVQGWRRREEDGGRREELQLETRLYKDIILYTHIYIILYIHDLYIHIICAYIYIYIYPDIPMSGDPDPVSR